jgi:hypothetical protein
MWVDDQSANWRAITSLWVNDQSANWRLLTSVWVNDQSTDWRLVYGGPAPTIDCVDLNICTVSGTPVCQTGSGCGTAGEQVRVDWTHTNCNDSLHHIRIELSRGGGGYYEILDDASCDAADNDSGCCDTAGCGPEDGTYVHFESYGNDAGVTTSYAVRVHADLDGGDTALDTGTDSCTNCGSDAACV